MVDTMVMDKTGTLTAGRLVVTDIVPAEGVAAADLLALVRRPRRARSTLSAGPWSLQRRGTAINP